MTSATLHFFGHDGHGSVRVLINEQAGTAEIYHYDAYGNAIGFQPAVALTTILYSGESFNANINLQYLRARYYNPATGTFNRLDPFFGNLEDPQSFHKYLYAHGDPVNGVDPTGMFFTLAGGLSVGGIRSHLNTKNAGVALVALDRAQTAADAFKAFSLLVGGQGIPLPLLAGLIISVVPGSGLAKFVGGGAKFFSPFIRAGNLAFDAGGDLASFLSRGGTGRLVDALDVMTDTFRGFKGAAAAARGSNSVVHFAGDLGAVKVADKLGLEAVDDFLIRHTGIDGLYRHGDDLVIVEAKGFTTGTSVSLGQTKLGGQQLSRDWIERKAVELRNLARTQPAYAQSAKILQDALDTSNIKVLLTKTEVSQAADEILDVAYELRNWADLGTNTFRP